MKRTETAEPFLSWCIINRNSGTQIEATLKSLRERTPQAEIVVVDTMSALDDPSIEIAKRYADVWCEYAGPKGNWDREMPWFSDAASARQHAFEQASGTWRGWIDSVTGDTPVLVRRRKSAFIDYIEIRELICSSKRERGDMCRERSDWEALTHEGWQTIRAIKQHRVQKKIYRVIDERGDVRVTEDHSLMSNGEQIAGRDLVVGTVLDHVEPDAAGAPQAAAITAELAEVWGFFAAEGTAQIRELSESSSNSNRYMWALPNTDRELLGRYQETLEAAYTRPFYFVEDPHNKQINPNYKAVWKLNARDQKDVALLFRKLFYSDAGRKKIPREILNGTDEIVRAFLRGYEQGDGHVRRATQAGRELQAFSTDSPILAAGLVHLYRRLGRDFYCNKQRDDKPHIVSCVERSGEPTTRSRLSSDDVQAIRDLRDLGVPVRGPKGIADRFDIDWSYVYRILRGELVYTSDSEESNKPFVVGIKQLVVDDSFDDYVYDLNTEAGTFVGGVGDFVLHNSDDVLPGGAEVKRLLEINGKWKPDSGQSETVGDGDEVTLEDMIRQVEEKAPDANCIYAPYLYRRDDQDRALIWQERERIVKWSSNWRWMEKAHEVLCPIDGVFRQRIDFAHLLFVHEKDFSEESHLFALRRHFDVLHTQYQETDGRTTRRCLYLSAYAPELCPGRQLEFIKAAHTCAYTDEDRYRAKIAEAEYYIARGLYRDSKEALGAATNILPNLPDAWITGAQAAVTVEDWVRADQWFETALKLPVTSSSLLQPRHMFVWYPVLMAAVKEKLAAIYTQQGDLDSADHTYDRALELLVLVLNNSPAVTREREQVAAMWRKVRNLRRGNQVARGIAAHASYLVDNDETQKAAQLLETVPCVLEDHPITIELEQWAKKVNTHLSDPAAYAAFYQQSEEHGIQIASPDHLIDHTSGASKEWIQRAYWCADWINENCPNGRILDLGCYDGLSAIPIMQRCPDIQYVGIDLNPQAVARLKKRFTERGLIDRAEIHLSTELFPQELINDLVKKHGLFDAVLWFEVIEHVPDPKPYMKMLSDAAKNGALMISTPWGPFDDGLPPDTFAEEFAATQNQETNEKAKSRDPRGHVRAMSCRNFVDETLAAGLVPIQVQRFEMEAKNGADTMHALVKAQYEVVRPTTFAVCAALWDWNSTTVHENGMGASEETICYLAKELAKTKELAKPRTVEVYGPIPDEEVQHGVRYWPHEQLRKVIPESKLVVSRAPHWGTVIDEKIGFETEKILWLQDAIYPDLNADVAAYYEKIVCVGEWQKQQMHANHGVPLDKMTVIGNFLLREHFVIDNPPERKPHHFIYASSPDRGLLHLLRMWPRIRDIYSDATLDIFYGWRGIHKLGSGMVTTQAWVGRFERLRHEYEALRFQPGVRELGMISHPAIAKEFMRASAWLYPSDFGETFCSNAAKSRAAGCVPVTSDYAALAHTAECKQSQIIHFEGQIDEKYEKAWLDGVVAAVETSDVERERMSYEAIKNHEIAAVMPLWERLLK